MPSSSQVARHANARLRISAIPNGKAQNHQTKTSLTPHEVITNQNIFVFTQVDGVTSLMHASQTVIRRVLVFDHIRPSESGALK